MDSLLSLLRTLSLQDLVLSGTLDIFNNKKWNAYWSTCDVQVPEGITYRIDDLDTGSAADPGLRQFHALARRQSSHHRPHR